MQACGEFMTIVSPSEPLDLRSYLENWSDDLELLRQNRLLDEGTFLRFARDRGIAVSGVGKTGGSVLAFHTFELQTAGF